MDNAAQPAVADSAPQAISVVVERFLAATGRRPRVLVAAVDRSDGGEDLRAAVVSVFADAGFDVDVAAGGADAGPVARQALDNDVHAITVIADEPVPFVTAVRAALTAEDLSDVLIVAAKHHVQQQLSSVAGIFVIDVDAPTTGLASILDELVARHA